MKMILQSLRTGLVDVCEVPPPELRPGGVLVRTLFSAISSGTERAKLEMGEKTLLGKALARRDQVQQVLAMVEAEGVAAAYRKVNSRLNSWSPLGYSSAGVVLEVGSGVSDLRPGDYVACGGVAYANHSEVNFVPRNLLVRVPEGVSLEAVSLTTIGAIAMQGLRQAETHVGESVAVIGAGLVGLLAIQIARASGCRVLALDVDPERAQFAATFGAHLALVSSDSRAVDIARQFSQYGLDAAIITAATRSTEPLDLAAEILRDRGRIVVVGEIGMGVSRRKLYDKELSIALSRSYGPGRYDSNYEEKGIDYPIGYVRWTERRNMEAFIELLATGSVDLSPLTVHICDIENAESAYDLIRNKKAHTVILRYPVHSEPQFSSLSLPPSLPGPVRAHADRRGADHAIRISCIGAGGFARDVVFPQLAKMAGVELCAVSTSSGYSAEFAARTYGFRTSSTQADIFKDPQSDAVFVLSRHDSHAQYIVRALVSGKPVFCEKPLAVSRRELNEIVAGYESQVSAGCRPFVMVGFNRRFSLPAEQMRDFFSGRREPMMIHIRINAGRLPREHWTHREGGRVVGEACHFVDFARALVNSPIKDVCATALPDSFIYTRDNVVANLSFADGSIANLLYLSNGDRSVPKEFYEVFCAGSVARLHDFRALELVRDGQTRKTKFKHDKGHRRELQLTVEALRSCGPPPIPFAELVEVTEATFRIAEAIGIQLDPSTHL